MVGGVSGRLGGVVEGVVLMGGVVPVVGSPWSPGAASRRAASQAVM